MTQKVKIGVVGCGVVATAYYLPYLMRMDHAEITAVCDRVAGRAADCVRLFGAKAAYDDYDNMLAQAELDAVFILTAPGTHVPFTLAAVQAGKHVLLQKPMATNLDDARAIAQAVRTVGVKALIEPSSNSPLDPDVAHLCDLVRQGALGDILWFTLGATGPTSYGPALGNNPYGQAAFYAADSGGFLFDLPYAPANLVAVLGPCQSVMAHTTITGAEQSIVPESEYDNFLRRTTDPDQANYWDVVVDLPRTQPVRMEAVDNAYSLYEMRGGFAGACHVGRIYHPVLPGSGSGSLQVFGTDGNLIFGAGYTASIISSRKELLPHVDADGWYHIPLRGDRSKAKWPQPTPGAFNYYHASSQHLVDCILTNQEPIPNVDWGLHITEMMWGTLESARTGQKYTMTTTLNY